MVLHKEPLVSVVVPIYNAEIYISRCVESILEQTYRNFELILVNDGSTDKSGAVCDEYAKNDDRIRVVHQVNGGVSSARNAGMNCAKGEYLFFVDADDWAEPDYLKSMLPEGDEDLVYVGHTDEYPDGRTVRSVPAECLMAIDQENRDFIQDIPMTFIFHGCYKADICRSCSITFDESVSVGEDVLFILQYLENCRSIRFRDRSDYHYCHNPGSVIRRYHSDKLEQQMAECIRHEEFMGKEDFSLRWRTWHSILLHYKRWRSDKQGIYRKDANRGLKAAYKSKYFKECIPYIRKNGTLDYKIETYFMQRWLHPFYKPFYRMVVAAACIKRLIVR
jgi:glycosyltransferase involved in cell wall biosynthesis